MRSPQKLWQIMQRRPATHAQNKAAKPLIFPKTTTSTSGWYPSWSPLLSSSPTPCASQTRLRNSFLQKLAHQLLRCTKLSVRSSPQKPVPFDSTVGSKRDGTQGTFFALVPRRIFVQSLSYRIYRLYLTSSQSDRVRFEPVLSSVRLNFRTGRAMRIGIPNGSVLRGYAQRLTADVIRLLFASQGIFSKRYRPRTKGLAQGALHTVLLGLTLAEATLRPWFWLRNG